MKLDYETLFYTSISIVYLLVAFILWYMFIYSPFDNDIRPRKEFLLTVGALFWPIAIIIAIVDSWSNYWE